MEIESRLAELARVKRHTRAFANHAQLRPQDAFDFVLAVHEIVANAIIHGNRGNPARRVRVELDLREGVATAAVTDEGAGFDYQAALAESRRRPEAPSPSGWGLMLVSKLVDEIEFLDEGRTVLLRKQLRPEGHPGG